MCHLSMNNHAAFIRKIAAFSVFSFFYQKYGEVGVCKPSWDIKGGPQPKKFGNCWATCTLIIMKIKLKTRLKSDLME